MDYRVQPRCDCGARDWIKDEYRHRVELEQMRNKVGRYRICDCPGLGKGFTHRHRIGSRGCCYLASGEAKSDEQARLEHEQLLAWQ